MLISKFKKQIDFSSSSLVLKRWSVLLVIVLTINTLLILSDLSDKSTFMRIHGGDYFASGGAMLIVAISILLAHSAAMSFLIKRRFIILLSLVVVLASSYLSVIGIDQMYIAISQGNVYRLWVFLAFPVVPQAIGFAIGRTFRYLSLRFEQMGYGAAINRFNAVLYVFLTMLSLFLFTRCLDSYCAL